MGDGIKPLRLIGMLAVGMAVFGAGIVFMAETGVPGAGTPSVFPDAKYEPAAPDDPSEDADAVAEVEAPKVPAPRVAPKPNPDPVPVVKGPPAWNGRWEKPSGLGLPNP